MTVRELIAQLEEVDDDRKEVFIYLDSYEVEDEANLYLIKSVDTTNKDRVDINGLSRWGK